MKTLDLEVKLGGEKPQILEGLREPKVDPAKYPVLSLALEHVVPAYSTKIEWTTPKGIEANWQQIFRFPFSYKFADPEHFGTEAQKALDGLLASLEATAVHGVPGHTPYTPLSQGSRLPCGFMGGVWFYLGREVPEPEDTIELRPLQMPILMLMRGEFDLYNDVVHHGEWLCETSLLVRAGS